MIRQLGGSDIWQHQENTKITSYTKRTIKYTPTIPYLINHIVSLFGNRVDLTFGITCINSHKRHDGTTHTRETIGLRMFL